MTGGGAKPAGLKRRLGLGQDAVLGPRPRRRFKSRDARFAPRAGFVVRAGRRKSAADVEHVVWRTGRKRHHLPRDGMRELKLHRMEKMAPGANGDAAVLRPVAV